MLNIIILIDVPNLVPPQTEPLITPTLVLLTCGQDITLLSTPTPLLIIMCEIFNGSNPVITEVFVNGTYSDSNFVLSFTSFDDDNFGVYTFKASVEGCGVATAESKILRQGQYVYIWPLICAVMSKLLAMT